MDRKLRVQVILDALDQATRPLRSIASQSSETGKALRAARDRNDALKRSLGDVAAHQRTERSLVDNALALRTARQRADELGRAYRAAETPTAKLTRQFTKAREEVSRLETEQNQHRSTLRALETRLEAAGVSTRDLANEERRLQRETSRANEEIDEQRRRLGELGEQQRRMNAARRQYDSTQQLAGTMQGAGMSSIAAGAAVGAPIVLAARQAITFEEAMADVRKVVDFDTPEAFERMGDDILTLSANLPLSAEGIAQIVAAAGQANIARGELLGFAEDAAKMAVAFDTTADESGAMMATWRTAFRMTQPEVRALADQVNYLGNNTAAGVDKVSEMVTRVGPLGEIGGLAAGQIAALAATMGAVGVDSDRGATGIQNLILGLTRGEAATTRQRQAFRALGLDAGRMSRSMQEDAGGAIMVVMERLKALPEHARAATLSNLFGRESIGAIAPLLNNLEDLQTNLDRVGDASLYAGSMQAEYDARAATTANTLLLLRNGAVAVATEFGATMLPQIQAGARWLGEIAQKVRTFADAHPGLTKAIVTVVGVISAALLVFGGLALAVAAVLGPFALLQFAMAGAGAFFAPVIAGLGGMAAAAWTAAAGFIAATWPILLIIAAVVAVALVIRRYWGPISEWVATHWAPMGEFLSALFGLIVQVVGLAVDWIWNLILRWTPMGFIVRNWGPISTFLTDLWRGIRIAVSVAMDAIRGVIANFSPLNAIKEAFAGVWSWLSGLPGRMLRAGADIMRGLADGIRGQRSRVQAASAEVAGSAEASARRRLDTHSPSRVFAAIGADTMAGLALGLSRNGSAAIGTIARIGAGMAGALAVATPSAAFDVGAGSGLSAGPAGSAAAGPAAGGDTITIQIYQQPGQDAGALADEVMRRLEARQDQRRLSGFRDPAGDWDA